MGLPCLGPWHTLPLLPAVPAPCPEGSHSQPSLSAAQPSSPLSPLVPSSTPDPPPYQPGHCDGWGGCKDPPWLPLDLSGRRPGAGLSPAPPRRRPPSLDSPLAFQQTPSPGRLGAGQGCGEPGALPRPSALPLGRGRGDSTHQRVRASAACRRWSVEPPSGPRWRGGVQAGAGASRASRLWALIGVPEREVCPHARRGCSGMGTLCLQPPVPEGRSLRPDYR